MKSREPTGAFDAVIPDLYDALLQPHTWRHVLGRLAEAAGLDGVHFLFADSAGRMAMSEISTQLTTEGEDLYGRYFGAIDPRRERLQSLPVGRFLLCQDEFNNDFVRRNEFYNDFLIPMNVRYVAATRPLRENGYDAMFGFLKKVGADPFDGREVATLRTLLPHLRRVAQIKHRLAAVESGAASLAGALDRLASGLAIVDGNARVRFVNSAAVELLHAADGLALRGQRLQATDPETGKRLERLIAEAVECAKRGNPHQGGGALAVARPGGKRAIALLITPLPAFSASLLWREEPSVAVFMTDPEAQPVAPAERLAELFGLTPAEARLAAALAAGDSLDQIAHGFSLSKYTLRAQLRALMSKTDTDRQAALVRLLVNSTQLLRR